MPLEFVWDPEKAEANRKKHRVTFDEASTVFADPLSLAIPDPDHSEREDRMLLLGTSRLGRLLVISHTWRDRKVRIISAREATRRERNDYEKDTF